MTSAAKNNFISSYTSENRGIPAKSRRPFPWSQTVRDEQNPTSAATFLQFKAPADLIPYAFLALLASLLMAVVDEKLEESSGQAMQGKKQFGKGERIGLMSLSWELTRGMFFL